MLQPRFDISISHFSKCFTTLLLIIICEFSSIRKSLFVFSENQWEGIAINPNKHVDYTDYFHNKYMQQSSTLGDESIIDISVILSPYKRNITEAQIEFILRQSIKVKDIHIYQNGDDLNLDYLFNMESNYRTFYSYVPPIFIHQNKNENFRYHGRFTLPLLLDSEYIAIYDDDIISGNPFLSNCLRIVNDYHAICGAEGQLILSDRYLVVFPPVNDDMVVDNIGWSWVFRREWIHYFWQDDQPSFSQGEDISFTMSLWINGGIPSMIPKQIISSDIGSIMSLHVGDDNEATYKKKSSIMLRFMIIKYWIEKGYIPVGLRLLLSSYQYEFHSSPFTYYIYQLLKDNTLFPMYNVTYLNTINSLELYMFCQSYITVNVSNIQPIYVIESSPSIGVLIFN